MEETLPAGRHTVSWDGRDSRGERVPSGRYFVRLVAGTEIHSTALLVMR